MLGAITLAQVSPADFDVTVAGELAPAELALGSALEAGPLEVVGFHALLGGGSFGE